MQSTTNKANQTLQILTMRWMVKRKRDLGVLIDGGHSMLTVSSVYLLWTLFENQMKEKKCLKSIFFFFFSFISCHANSKWVNIQLSTNKKKVTNMIPSALFWAMTKQYLQYTRQSGVLLFTLWIFCCLFVKFLNVFWKFDSYNPLSQRQSMLTLSTFKKLKKKWWI